MAPSILEGELAAAVADALADADVPRDVIVRRTVTTGNPAEPWNPGETITTDYSCKGWIEHYSDDAIDGTLIDLRDIKIAVLVATITTMPSDGDTIELGGAVYLVVSSKRDASGALFEVQARR